ncbi:iron chelate uptake ABC transporter family permease subunit [Naumannella sp. ID2617S]|nr:iron chelate uptake ABC transporter family permease subunit [Naumannella sp. ID2617S]
MSAGIRLGIVGFLALATIAAFYLIGSAGNLDFVISYRSRKVAAMVLVGWAVALSTVLFHTVTSNRILTPAVMGFDSLYQLLQTGLVFSLGVGGMAAFTPPVQFAVTTVVMTGVAVVLFGSLFGRLGRSLHVTILVGLVAGTLMRALSTLMQRVMDPTAHLSLQSRLFASFSNADPRLIGITTVLVVLASAFVWHRRRELDVLALGPELSTALGVDHRRATLQALVLVSVLVSVSTALVGPILFFGLLVANLAYQLAGTHRHAVTLPMAGLLAVLTLVGGQAILEHVFELGTVLSVIVEFVGGLVFLGMLLGVGRRTPGRDGLGLRKVSA